MQESAGEDGLKEACNAYVQNVLLPAVNQLGKQGWYGNVACHLRTHHFISISTTAQHHASTPGGLLLVMCISTSECRLLDSSETFKTIRAALSCDN